MPRFIPTSTHRLIGAFCLGVLALAGPAAAQKSRDVIEDDFEDYRHGPVLTLKAGTLGLGAEVTYGLHKLVRVRAGVYGFKAGFGIAEENIDYDMNLTLLSGAGYLDFHPFGNQFRISAGLFYNRNKIKATGQPSGAEFIIGDSVFLPDEVGTLTGDIRFNKIAPYAGIGWGNPLTRKSNWAFEADIGVVFQGRPDVALSTQGGTLAGNAIFEAELRREEQDLEEEIRMLRFYPVVSLGFAYTF